MFRIFDELTNQVFDKWGINSEEEREVLSSGDPNFGPFDYDPYWGWPKEKTTELFGSETRKNFVIHIADYAKDLYDNYYVKYDIQTQKGMTFPQYFEYMNQQNYNKWLQLTDTEKTKVRHIYGPNSNWIF